MTLLQTIRKARRLTWRTSSVLGDAEAIDQSVQKRSVKPVARRVARKAIYRAEGKATRSILKQMGL